MNHLLHGRASELKQQGAIEAAQDPNSSVTADDATRMIVNEQKKAGGQAFMFNADATPEEKAAQIAGTIPDRTKIPRKINAATLASDTDTGPPQYDLPPPSKAGVVMHAPGDHEDDEFHEAEEGEWKRMGWKPRFGALPGDFNSDESMQDTQTWLEMKLDDKFYGDWYHNAGIIVFACLATYIGTILGAGLAWLAIVMAVCGTYYRTSIRRVRRNYRDDINRDLAKAKLETDNESLEWINSFLVKFWPIYAPVICKIVVGTVDQVLSTSTPAFLDSLRLGGFTLGTKPPRLEHVKTYPKSEDDIVMMDWKFSFTPNDISDMTARQAKLKQNPKIVLEIRVGKGLVSKALKVIVEDMACSGIMRVKMKLMLDFPYVEKVEICFLGKPTIDYVCKPIGGDMFGLDTNFIPGLSGFILEQIHANLGPMMYSPNVFPIEIAKMLAGSPIDQAIGVVQIQLHSGQGLGAPGGGTPDPYVLVTINGRTELHKTKTIKQNANPTWNETINVVITSLKDTIDMQVYDFNEYRKDRDLGEALFPLERLEEVEELENEQMEVVSNGKARGQLMADFRYFPILGESKLQDGTVIPPPESLTGIARFTVEQAKDLDGTKSLIGELSPYAVLLLNGKEVHTSKKLKRTNNPIWEDAHKELLITDRKNAKLGLVIKDDRDLAADPIIGTYQIKLEDMLELTAKGQEWYNLANVKSGRAKMMLQWKPVALRGALAGGGYITPIGVMRLHFKNARDLKNLETVGKSDPYIRVLVSGVQKGRTVTFKNNLNPDWDEVIYVPVHTTREKVTIECMDEEMGSRDRSLGHFAISVSDYAHQLENGEWDVNDSKKNITQALTFGTAKQNKGTVNYTCSFFPTIPVIDPEEEEREKAEQAIREQESASGAEPRTSLDNGSIKSTNAGSVVASRARSNTSTTVNSIRAPATRVASANDVAKQLARGEETQEELVHTISPVEKIRLTADDLLKYGGFLERAGYSENEFDQSGLLIFKLIEGDLAQSHCHLEVVIDDYAFPAHSSAKVSSRHHIFNETGEAMIRELDQSRITLRLVEHIEKEGKGSENHAIARLSGPTLNTLQKCLYTPTQLTLRDEKGHESKITISLKFLPVKMYLDPSESFSNMGKLRVDILDASDLPAADRNGYSDPYCKFMLNEQTIHKTDKQKKTLHPAWNETFETMIRSRTAARFVAEIWDWDLGDKDDFLGKAVIDLASLEPMQPKTYNLPLDGKSGTVRLRLLFTPEFVTRIRQGTSTFQGTFAAPGKIVGAPVKVVGGVVGGVGGGIGKAGSLLGKPFRRRKSGRDGDLTPSTPDNEDASAFRPVTSDGFGTPNGNGALHNIGPEHGDISVPAVAVDPSTPNNMAHSRGRSSAQHSRAESQTGVGASASDQGTGDIAIVSAAGFPSTSNLRFITRIEQPTTKAFKEIHKTKGHKFTAAEPLLFPEGSESFKTPCAADTPFRIMAINDHRLRSDEILGEGVFYLSDQGSSSAMGAEHTVKIGHDGGVVQVRSRFTPADAQSMLSTTPNKGVGGAGGSMRLSKAFGRKERGGTPS